METQKKHLIYIMNVPWSWLKQRPHFLAYYLSQELPVKIFYRSNLLRSSNKGKEWPENIVGVFQFPLTRFKFISFINDLIFKFCVFRELNGASHILFQSPQDFFSLKKYLNVNIKIIYDCMDDLIEFKTKHGEGVENLMIKEGELCKCSDYIFVSSRYLGNKISGRYKCNVKPVVLNNAVDIKFVESSFVNKYERESRNFIELYYVGTIAEWFDFDLIVETLLKFENLKVILVGVSVVKIPIHDRLVFCGRIPHDQLADFIKRADGLVMPFKITELVRSVNPVKLYEYISTNAPIITCDYEEIDVFDDYVYRYKSKEDFFSLIDMLLKKKLEIKTEKQRFEFLKRNTWKSRAAQMASEIL